MKNFKKIKKSLCLLLVAICSLAAFATGCGGSGDSSAVKFWVYGDEDELELYTLMTDKFNDTYGKKHGYHVDISVKPPSSYESLVRTSASTKSGPDVFFVVEDYFKSWVGQGFLAPLEEEFNKIDDIDDSNIYPSTVSRFRYDVENGTSYDTAPLYAMPLDTKPTALYYNETFFKKAGIVVISVDEENLEAFNTGNVKDNRGKTLNDYKKEYPVLNNLTGNIPAKGFFRSFDENIYVDGDIWQKPAPDEILIFNNRIAMNWDEVEDLAMIFTPEYNPNAAKDFGSKYGYFTEWWFNYGWSIGGDCLEDLTGNGDWNFSLLDATPNYLVQKEGFVGEYTGNAYHVGETVEFLDKLDVPKGEKLVANDDGTYSYNNKVVGIREAIKNNDKLYELPSTRDAFTRYLKLGAARNTTIEGVGGLNISPNPDTFSTVSRQRYFYTGEMAMLVDYSMYMNVISEQAAYKNYEWDIAPLVVYKEYTNPEKAYDGSYVAKGKVAGQNNSKAMCTRKKAQNKDGAAAFIKWMASSKEGQQIRVDLGFFPNDPSYVDQIKYKSYAPKNAKAFAEALSYQEPGDWWYMPDFEWINIWAVPLNAKVRNGLMSYDEWKSTCIHDTNKRLSEFYH